jgi:hypothetical protein
MTTGVRVLDEMITLSHPGHVADHISVILRFDILKPDAPIFTQCLGCRKDAAAVPPHMDLGRFGCIVSPHRADLLHAAGVMPERAMHRAILGLQFVEPGMYLLKRLPERTTTILAMFFKTGHAAFPDATHTSKTHRPTHFRYRQSPP